VHGGSLTILDSHVQENGMEGILIRSYLSEIRAQQGKDLTFGKCRFERNYILGNLIGMVIYLGPSQSDQCDDAGQPEAPIFLKNNVVDDKKVLMGRRLSPPSDFAFLNPETGKVIRCDDAEETGQLDNGRSIGTISPASIILGFQSKDVIVAAHNRQVESQANMHRREQAGIYEGVMTTDVGCHTPPSFVGEVSQLRPCRLQKLAGFLHTRASDFVLYGTLCVDPTQYHKSSTLHTVLEDKHGDATSLSLLNMPGEYRKCFPKGSLTFTTNFRTIIQRNI
jgi:hypothetical protein